MITLTQIITWLIALLAPMLAGFIALLIFSKGAWKINSTVSFKNICYGVMHNPIHNGLMVIKDFKVDTNYQKNNSDSEVYYDKEDFRISSHSIFKDLEEYLTELKIKNNQNLIKKINNTIKNSEEFFYDNNDFKNIEIADITLRNSGRMASVIKPPEVRLEIQGKIFHPKINPIYIQSDTIDINKNGIGKLEPGDSITFSYSLYEIFLWTNNFNEKIKDKYYVTHIDTLKETISNKRLEVILSHSQKITKFMEKLVFKSSIIKYKKVLKITVLKNKTINNIATKIIKNIAEYVPYYIELQQIKQYSENVLKFEYESSNKNKQITNKINNWNLSNSQFKMFSYNNSIQKQMKKKNIFPHFKSSDCSIYIEDINNPLIFNMIYFSITQEIFAAIAHENMNGLSSKLDLEEIVKFTSIYREIVMANIAIYKKNNPDENNYYWEPSNEEQEILKNYINSDIDRDNLLEAINNALCLSNQKFEYDSFYLGTPYY
jgi:hypothetical protein